MTSKRSNTNKTKTNFVVRVVVPITVSRASVIRVVVPRAATQHSEVPTPLQNKFCTPIITNFKIKTSIKNLKRTLVSLM